jgi:hypothetical protein
MTEKPVCTTATRPLASILVGTFVVACPLLIGACSSATSPTTPAAKFEPPPGTYRSTFTALKGETGFAGISVTPKAIPEGTFTADISVRLKGLKGNTTYLLQRAQEGVGGRPLGGDGVCQRALGVTPWSPSDAPTTNFQTVPLPNTGPLITVTTAASGDGTLDFEFRTLMIMAGTTNDVMYRLVDNDTAPTTELRSPCMTIAAQ